MYTNTFARAGFHSTLTFTQHFLIVLFFIFLLAFCSLTLSTTAHIYLSNPGGPPTGQLMELQYKQNNINTVKFNGATLAISSDMFSRHSFSSQMEINKPEPAVKHA